MLVNEQRQKLSKRKDPVAVEAYRDQGYLPDAFRNYLALLGWSPPGEAEMVDLGVLIGAFRLEDVHHAPAFFDVRKLTHLNGEYIRRLPTSDFVAASGQWVSPQLGEWSPSAPPPWPPERFDQEKFEALAPLVQERVAVLGDIPAMVDFVFLADPPIDPASWEKAVAGDPAAPAILAAAERTFAACGWTVGELHEATLALAEAVGRKLGKAQAPIRVAVTGRSVGLPLFESLQVLGREEVLRRLRLAIVAAGDAAAGAGSAEGSGVESASGE
jgi:glutamyl-tRNA synthetase